MRLSDHDLRPMDEAYLEGLSLKALQEVSKRLGHDRKEAREQLNQTPVNSARSASYARAMDRGAKRDRSARTRRRKGG